MTRSNRWIARLASVVMLLCNSMPVTLLAEPVFRAQHDAMLDAIARLAERIRELEQVQDMAPRISQTVGGSVGLIVGEYTWTDPSGRTPLRYEANNNLEKARAQRPVTFDGDGPVVVREFQGTGFLLDPRHLLTSTFLLSPWESDPLLDVSENPQIVPWIRMLHLYLPGIPKPIDLQIDHPAESLDAVICVLLETVPNVTVSVSSGPVALGDPILLLGYPRGLAMLASRIPNDVRRELYSIGQPTLDEAARFLAARGYIAPVAMQSSISGHIENHIFFEAFVSDGSPGAPILDVHGDVIAINQAIYPAHPSSNIAAAIGPLQSWIADVSSR